MTDTRTAQEMVEPADYWSRPLVDRLRERAAIARSEGTGTAIADAGHFDEAATLIASLSEENAAHIVAGKALNAAYEAMEARALAGEAATAKAVGFGAVSLKLLTTAKILYTHAEAGLSAGTPELPRWLADCAVDIAAAGHLAPDLAAAIRKEDETTAFTIDVLSSELDEVKDRLIERGIDVDILTAKLKDAEAVRTAILKLTRRVEPISGQRFSYVKLEDVLAILAATEKEQE